MIRNDKRSWSRWALVGLAAGAVLTAVLLLVAALSSHGGEEVALIRVERSAFVRWMRADGYLRAVRATPILVPSEVRQAYQVAWLAPEGEPVARGEPVLRFDPSELTREAQDARARLQTTELRIRKRAATAAADAVNLERDAELASEELEAIAAHRKRDETIFSRFEIVAAGIDAELAAERQRHANESRQSSEALAGTELDLLAIEQRENERALERTQKALGLLEVVAPHDGILVVERDWHGQPMRVGNTVYSGQKIAELPDLSEMEAEVFILEADAGGLEVGQQARLVVESDPLTVYDARVSRVDTLAKPRLRGSPVQYFGATLELESTDPEVMRLGQRVRADILVDDLREVLVVPRQAIVERDDAQYVFVKRRDRFEQVPITAGVSGLGRTVVTAGLEEGDLIAARDPGLGVERLGFGAARSDRRRAGSAPAAGDGR